MKKEIHVSFDFDWELHEKDFELYYVNNLHTYDTQFHSHDYYEFTFFLSGTATLSVGQTEYKLSPGHVILVPPNTKHCVSHLDKKVSYTSFIILVSKDYFNSLLNRTDDYGYILQQTIHTKNYIYLIEKNVFGMLQKKILTLLEEQQMDRFGKSEQVNVCINDLLLTLNRVVYELAHPNVKDTEYTLAHKLASYTEKHLSENLTLDLLAEHFFVSKYHISHIFKKNFGITFHQYLTRKRLELVRTALLQNEDISNKYTHYGFKDYSGLFRAFKKEYGVSPTEYQKQYSIRRDL